MVSNFYVIFKENCLKEKTATFTSPHIINCLIIYELDTWSRDLNSNFTLKDYILGGVELAKNAEPDKCVYSGYGIGFDSRSELPLPDSSVGKNVIIFGVDMRSSVHIDNKKKKDILILGKDPTQGLDDTALTEEVQYPTNFSGSNRELCLSLRYNRSNSFFICNFTKYINSKQKILK